MIILTIRTDNPEAELGLYRDESPLAYETWAAHRELGRTIHSKIEGLLGGAGLKLGDVEGIVAFQGPGSFTGLRIGLTVANTLAYALPCTIVGATGDTEHEWIYQGLRRLADGADDRLVMPEYGSEANITLPRK